MMNDYRDFYWGDKKEQGVDEQWSEIIELEALRNIRQRRSSTRMIQIHWGDTAILIAEERHYESL